MYLWDSHILRHFGEVHPNVHLHLKRVGWSEIALPSVVVAEVLRGRCEYALKAVPENLPFAHEHLIHSMQLLDQFNILVFDEESSKAFEKIKQSHKTNKRYADVLIAAMARAGKHIVVTRNEIHFKNLLPKTQIENWVDNKPN